MLHQCLQGCPCSSLVQESAFAKASTHSADNAVKQLSDASVSSAYPASRSRVWLARCLRLDGCLHAASADTPSSSFILSAHVVFRRFLQPSPNLPHATTRHHVFSWETSQELGATQHRTCISSQFCRCSSNSVSNFMEKASRDTVSLVCLRGRGREHNLQSAASAFLNWSVALPTQQQQHGFPSVALSLRCPRPASNPNIWDALPTSNTIARQVS